MELDGGAARADGSYTTNSWEMGERILVSFLMEQDICELLAGSGSMGHGII